MVRNNRFLGVSMVRKVFFSFHFDRDIWRAGQVRNSWVTEPDREEAGYIDAVSWEEVRKNGENAVKEWIDGQLEGTSVTIVLIGAETSERDWVQYEIESSMIKGNGLLGIYIHDLKNQDQETDPKGADPFVKLGYLGIKTYDWVSDEGYENIGDWVEAAYEDSQRTVIDKEFSFGGWDTKTLRFPVRAGDRIRGFVKESKNNWLKIYIMDEKNYQELDSFLGWPTFIAKAEGVGVMNIDHTVPTNGIYYLYIKHNDWWGDPETVHVKIDKGN